MGNFLHSNQQIALIPNRTSALSVRSPFFFLGIDIVELLEACPSSSKCYDNPSRENPYVQGTVGSSKITPKVECCIVNHRSRASLIMTTKRNRKWTSRISNNWSRKAFKLRKDYPETVLQKKKQVRN
jgi:hypothetical protein